MSQVLTADEMRRLERAYMDSGAVTGLELMERAGRGVTQAIFEMWPELAEAPGRALVLCGPGNNGGDGYVVARLLAARGWDVAAVQFGDPAKLPPDAGANHLAWADIGPVRPYGPSAIIIDEKTLFIDALFGIGQTRPLGAALEGDAAHVALVCGISPTAHAVAIDIPSGVNSDTGDCLGDFQLFADLTVTFHALKPCHQRAEAKKRCGKVVVKDIGLPHAAPGSQTGSGTGNGSGSGTGI
ncbi:MAG: NAD(P)H-hydrate epimerase [Rhodobacteraceae bacterium]|nr:NAD(P)H-hydrate epimerase [Paracoccaceae bacterium]